MIGSGRLDAGMAGHGPDRGRRAVARLAAASRPQLAFVLWLVVFVKCVTPPLWSSPSGAFCWLQVAATTPGFTARWRWRRCRPMQLPWFPATITEARLPRCRRPTHVCRWISPPCWPFGSRQFGSRGIVAVLTALAVAVATFCQTCFGRQAAKPSAHGNDVGTVVAPAGTSPARAIGVDGASVGPAVLGLFRPTVLLPQAVIEASRPTKSN